MGQYHMIVVAVDSEMTQFQYLDYASEIFDKFKEYLLANFFTLMKKSKQIKQDFNQVNERVKIEMSLKEIFQRDKERFPLAGWGKFYDFLFEKLQMNFNETLSLTLDKLQKDLVGSNEDNLINLKELRDQILGYRVNTNCVFGWGLKDERLCVKPSNQDKARRYMRTKILGDLNNKHVIRVECGNSFSIALTQNGDVYAWGIGKSGSLGLGEISTITHQPTMLCFQSRSEETLNATDPEKRREGDKSDHITAIASGQTHCLALTKYGGVYSWGNGQGGRLGHGDSIGQNVPEKITFFENKKIVDIVCGDQHSGCINEQGQVYVWGVGLNGRCGVGFVENIEIPQILSDFNHDPCSRLFFGMNTSFAITKSSELYAWGSGQYGKLGLPNSVQQQILTPRKLFTLSSKRIAEFAVGSFHTLALTYDGLIYGFGNSKEGKLGIKLAEQQAAMRIDEDDAEKVLSNMVEIPTLLLNAPKFYIQGELKQVFKTYQKFQNYTSEAVLKDVDKVKKTKVIQTACGDKNSYFLTNSGHVFATGSNDRWQCSEIEEAKNKMDLIQEEYLNNDRFSEQEWAERGGHVIPNIAAKLIREVQEMQQINRPYEVLIFPDLSTQQLLVKQMSAGANHVLIVTQNCHVYGWGDNEFGQLGLGRLLQGDQDSFVPKPTILKDLQDKRVLMTASGRSHSLFLTQLGQVYAAGYNEFGQLGVKSEPLKIQQNKNDIMSSILDNYYYAKTKPTPQRVDVENVRFIAAGDSHSFAISDSSHDGNQTSNLYSWGWGAFGQLGHHKIKNYYNLDRPKKVKFRDALDLKIAFVSGGSKHSLCLDMEGRMWYFGNKMSVGIREPLNKLQFEPVMLTPTTSSSVYQPHRGFSFVDCTEDSNLVISAADNAVYYFGAKNMIRSEDEVLQDEYQSDEDNQVNQDRIGFDFETSTHQTDFIKISSKKKKDFKACYVSIGQDHFVATEIEEVIPYSWGSNASGQLGNPCKICHQQEAAHQRKKSSNHNCGQQKDPQAVIQFKNLVSQQSVTHLEFMKAIQDEESPNTSPREQQVVVDTDQKKWRYPIQAQLKKQHQGIPGTYELLKADIKIQKKLNKVITDFNRNCTGVDLCTQTMKARAQDGLITRIIHFPTPVAEHTLMQSSIPKSISRNRQVFETIFTYIQSHPCYLIEWIKNTKFFDEPEDLHLLLSAVFGKREMKNNSRIINTLMIIAKAMFDEEAQQNKFKELCSVFRTDSPFRTIFKIIFDNQTQNLGFVKDVIAKLLINQQEMLRARYNENVRKAKKDEDAQFSQEQLSIMLREILLTTLETIRKRIDLLGGMDLEAKRELKDQNHLTLQVLSLLDYAYVKLMNIAQENQKQKEGAGGNIKKKEEIKKSPAQADNGGEEGDKEHDQDGNLQYTQRELIFPYLLDILFESFVETLENLTYEDIAFDVWNVQHTKDRSLPDKDIFGSNEGIVLLQQLAKNLKMYFRSQIIDVAPHFRELLSTGAVSLGTLDNNMRNLANINFRDEIAQSLFCQNNFKPYDLEFILVRQLFDTCLEMESPILSATVSDIVYVYNSLVSNEDIICAKNFPKDPLRHMIRSMGGKQIDPQLSNEALRMRVNLQLSCRFLYNHKELAKCSLCFAPVIESMISEQRFREAVAGKAWRCRNRQCQRNNSAGIYQCSGCGSTMPNELLGKDLVFRQFERVKASPDVKLFKFALKTLPMIEENQDIVTLIDQTVDKIVISVQADQIKQEKLLRFKEMIEDYQKNSNHNIFPHLSKMNMVPEDLSKDQNKKLSLILSEKMYLDGVAEEVEKQAEIKKNHQRQLKIYQASLVEIIKLDSFLKQQTISVCQNLDTLLYNAYTGLSSKFLKDKIESQGGNFMQKKKAQSEADDPNGKNKIKERVWAGSLHIELNMLSKMNKKKKSDKEKLFGESMKTKLKSKSKNDIINEFFAEITTSKALSIEDSTAKGLKTAAHGQGQEENQTNQQEQKARETPESICKDLIKLSSDGGGDVVDERAITGRIKFVHMQRDQVIKSVDQSRYDFEILKQCHFTFNDNGQGGFFIELVYKEPAMINLGSAKNDSVVLENFQITREILMEMRRNFAFHSLINFGMLQFRVHQLVKELNAIIAMNNIFQSISLDENGYRVRKEPQQAIKADKEEDENKFVLNKVEDEQKSPAKEAKKKESKKAKKENVSNKKVKSSGKK